MEILNLEHALSYAKKGFKIIPLQPNGKVPIRTDFFSNGANSATADQEEIFKVWSQEQFVGCNIGLKVGKDENIVCIDIDAKTEDKNGFKTIEVIERELQPLPPTYTVKTLSGEHRFYQYPKGVDLRRQINAFDSVDILADGYCVAPPSCVDGNFYQKVSGSLLELAEFPSFLLPFLVKDTSNSMGDYSQDFLKEPLNAPLQQGKMKYTAKFLTDIVDGATTGGRNDFLMKVTAKCLALGTGLETIYSLLIVINENFVSPPLPENEVNTLFKSITKKHLKKVG